jgi:hypothetical protein
MSPTLTLLLAALDEAFDAPSWHGPNLRASLRGITPAQAAARPADGRHNIWELAVHCAYWKYVARRRLTGAKRGGFPLPGSNFLPRPVHLTVAAWRADLALLESEHRLLRAAVADLSPAAQCEPERLRIVRGVAAHDLYHAGQIRLLRRLSAAKRDR